MTDAFPGPYDPGMAADISFRAERHAASFLDPRAGFDLARSDIEVRFDPLTGRASRLLSPRGVIEVAPADAPERPTGEHQDAGPASAPCIFCAPNVFDVTPKSALLSGGRHAVGEAFLFPNLFPYAKESAVCVYSTTHDVDLLSFDERRLADALRATRDFVHLATRAHGPDIHPAVFGNYQRPAGSSVAHPHLQAIADPVPLTVARERADGVEAYARATGRRWFDDLAAAEREAGRGIARLNCFDWIAPFAPRGSWHVQAIGHANRALEEQSDHELEDLADGLVRIFRTYRTVGVRSLNLLMVAGSAGDDPSRRFPPVLDILARQTPGPEARNDVTALEILGGEPGIDVPPESVADHARPFFAEL